MNDNIFRPHFTITDKVKDLIVGIDRQIWLANNMLLMPKHEAWIRRDVSIRRAAGTTAIEGSSLDEDAVGDLLRKPHAGRPTQDEQANINAIQAYEFIDYVSDQDDIPIDELVIRQINREFLSGAADTLTPGVYRKGQNTVGDYQPPDQGDVPALMRSFAVWLRGEDDLHPIVRAAIVHIHLVAIHPFWDGNGRAARGLATLVLQRSLVDSRKLLSLEMGMSAIRDQYISAIQRTLGTQFEPVYDATPWIEFFTETLFANALGLISMLTEWRRMMDDAYKQFERAELNSRQADGFAYAIQTGKITRAEYMEITGASGGTASRDLAGLVEAGVLIPEGKTRARIYTPRRDEAELEAQPPPEQLPLVDEPLAPATDQG